MLQRIVEPTVEPITLAEARLQCKADGAADDPRLALAIFAARDYAENHMERSLCTQTWEMTLDYFPCEIVLERPPIQSITSIRYLDMSGVWQTVATTEYVDLTQSGAQRVDDLVRITPAFGKTWPIPMPQIGSVRVRYVAGYGIAKDMPPNVRNWMLMRVATLFDNPCEIPCDGSGVEPLPFVDSMLNQFLVRRAA